MSLKDRLLSDEAITKHELPDGDYDITGLLQAQDKETADFIFSHLPDMSEEEIKQQIGTDDPDILFAAIEAIQAYQKLIKEMGK